MGRPRIFFCAVSVLLALFLVDLWETLEILKDILGGWGKKSSGSSCFPPPPPVPMFVQISQPRTLPEVLASVGQHKASALQGRGWEDVA